ncbi:hypothetical protein AX17_000083 [Amanita inopinata Kibby_2008]|nr:hypothetical protein AX17_000083 [Amanita inopinata Kibby_2008]
MSDELTVPLNKMIGADGDNEFRPNSTKKSRARGRTHLGIEDTSTLAHTLVEHHEHVLSASFDLSNIGHPGDKSFLADPSSTQEDFGFIDFFPISDTHPLEVGLDDGLAKELGWESPVKFNDLNDPFQGVLGELGIPALTDDFAQTSPACRTPPLASRMSPMELSSDHERKISDPLNNGYTLDSPNINPENIVDRSNSKFVVRQVTSLDSHTPEDQEARITRASGYIAQKQGHVPQPIKRKRLLLDPRTELTDDELKISRTGYTEAQNAQRREYINRLSEKESCRLIEVTICGAPTGAKPVSAPALAQFWQDNLNLQLTSKVGIIRMHGVPKKDPLKGRKTVEERQVRSETKGRQSVHYIDSAIEIGGEGQDVEFGATMIGQLRSSEVAVTRTHYGDILIKFQEPGQGRYISRPPSVIGSNLALDIGLHDSAVTFQQSFLFPWDNAGPSSSTGSALPGINGITHPVLEHVDAHLRGSSRSRGKDSLAPSQLGSNPGIDFSPAPPGRGSQGLGEDYEFEVRSSAGNSVIFERQQTEMNAISLERNSLNFLEHVLPWELQMTQLIESM